MLSEAREVRRVLDLAFGFFVWALHFLAVYVGTALACVLELRAAFQILLVLVTIAAALLVAGHALRRYRQQRDPDEHFATKVTVGCDAIALVGILWQLFPIFLVPACA